MKKINLIALLLISMVVFSLKSSVAQNTTFKLSDYKNPKYFYQTLNLDFGLGNILSGQKFTGTDNSSAKNFNFNSYAGVIYSRYINSPKAQGDLSVNLNAGVGSFNSNSNYSEPYNMESKNNSFSHDEDLNMAGLHRFYNQKQNFIEINGSLSLSNSYNSGNEKNYTAGTATSDQESKSKNFRNSIAGSFLIGKGRIEQVQDAQMAMYLLDDLYRLNREKRSVSDQDVNNLAQLITRLKYKRFFDYRLRKIAEITAIDSLMQINGIISSVDAAYFTSLNDNWNYANNPRRDNGQRLYTGLEANFGYTYQNSYQRNTIPADLTVENTNKHKSAGLFMVLGYSYEKPTSRKWQNSSSIEGGFGIHQHNENRTFRYDPNPETNTKLYTQSFPSAYLSGNFGFGYYPTSRTWMTFNWRLNCSWDKNKEGQTKSELKDSENDIFTTTGPQLNAYYFLSEKLRLSFSFNGQFRFDNYKYTSDIPAGSPDKSTQKYWTQTMNASLTYSMF
jgi:hypothetical protein